MDLLLVQRVSREHEDRGKEPLGLRRQEPLGNRGTHLLESRERRLLVQPGVKRPLRLEKKRAVDAAEAGACHP